MKQPVFTGAAVAIITPMHADGTVNVEELGRIIDDQIAHGTDAIVICGTTGESAALSHEEHVECIRFAVKHTAKRVPVIAGTGSNDTAFAIEISKEAEEAGADALLLVTPYYNKTSQAGLIAHYTAIANAVTLPCIIYNVPSRTGVNLQPATLAELAKLPNVNAVKEASGNISQVADVAALCGEELNIYLATMTRLCRSCPWAVRASSACFPMLRRSRHTISVPHGFPVTRQRAWNCS